MSEPPKILKISTFASKSVIHGFGTRFFSLPELRDSLPSLNIITLTQIHSSKVLLNSAGEGDGVISRDPGTILVIKTADCLPVLIKDDEERIVAALHAGWKGLCKGIIFKGIAKIKNLGFNKKNLRVALGPSIGPCCYTCRPSGRGRARKTSPAPWRSGQKQSQSSCGSSPGGLAGSGRCW